MQNLRYSLMQLQKRGTAGELLILLWKGVWTQVQDMKDVEQWWVFY